MKADKCHGVCGVHYGVLTVALTLMALLGCADDPAGPGSGESVAAFRAAFDGPIVSGKAIGVEIVAIGEDGSDPLLGFDGFVALSASMGSVEPATLQLSDGHATAAITLSDAWGSDVRLILTAEGVRSEIGLAHVTVSSIPGASDAVAIDALPTFELVPFADEYRTDHPNLGNVWLSHTLILVAFSSTTTVAEANSLLESLDATVAGAAPGVACLRIHSEGHSDTDALLATLASDPRVAHAVPDILLDGTLVTRPNGGVPADWTWESNPSTGNWGLERIRVPAMWNLNGWLEKRGRSVRTAVIDAGFTEVHSDLTFQVLGTTRIHDHGTHVAGTIGARFDNGVGVDGVNPFTTLLLYAPAFSGGGVAARVSWGQTMTGAISDLVDLAQPVDVINMSLGYNWSSAGIDPSTSPTAQFVATTQGAILAGMLEFMGTFGTLPLICVAAGNEAGATSVPDADWSSPMTNAALVHLVDDILVVENVQNSPGSGDGDVSRSASSCINGHISAPGQDILSTFHGDTYGPLTGTSMATPHVAGLVGYLLAIDPTLSNQELVQLLAANSKSAGSQASNRIDAWGSAVDIDRIRGNDAVLRALLDIDDGTVDGNLRVDYGESADFGDEDVDLDGGVGDGQIDMSDFRRWRDWRLYVGGAADLSLDGSALHDKKDVNGNGSVGTAAEESIHPRGDFNGDGWVDETLASYYPGRIARDVTDLEVLQELFSDPDYTAAELTGLLESGDLAIDGSALMVLPNMAEARVVVRRQSDGGEVATRDFTNARSFHVITVPADAGGYEVEAEVRDASFTLLAEYSMQTTLRPGEDRYWKSGDDVELFVEIIAPDAVVADDPFDLDVYAGFVDPSGNRTYAAGIDVSLVAAGIAFADGLGTTNAEGRFGSEARTSPELEATTLFATVSMAGFEPATASRSIVVLSGVPAVALVQRLSRTQASTHVTIRGSAGNSPVFEVDATEERVEDIFADEVDFGFSAQSSGSTAYGQAVATGQASGSAAFTTSFERVAGRIVRWTGSGTAACTVSSSGLGVGDEVLAVGLASESVQLQISSPARVRISVSQISASGRPTSRSAFNLRATTGGAPIVSLEIPGDGAPSEVDIVLDPDRYTLNASAIASENGNGTGSAVIAWEVSFSNP